MTPVFFYGLFMDADLLREKGLNPTSSVISCVEDFDIHIGTRATLISAEGERVYGTVMMLDDEELQALYGETSVADYRPEPVEAITADKDVIRAIVYNLPKETLDGQNLEYTHALIEVAKKIGLPDAYVAKLESMTHQ